jgi:ABC-type phosphate/phosphonate transport system substrate-binding protein
MIASLGMYDFGAAQAANNRYWVLIRDGLRADGIAAPDALTRGDAAYWPAWQAADLVLSQTCGYPFRALLSDKVTLVGTPHYDLPDCPPGHYYSVFVARKGDRRVNLAAFDGARLAYNEPLSQSGWAAPQTHAAKLGIDLLPALRTGGHLLSARTVAEGHADIAALDAVTWSMIQALDPVAGELQVIDRTEPTPVLPYITAKGTDPGPIFSAIRHAIAGLEPADRTLLRLLGVVAIPSAAYLAVPNPPSPDLMLSVERTPAATLSGA